MSSVTFDGKNYIAYEKWVRQRYGKLTPLQTAHQNALREADKLCATCVTLPDARRLCNGTRRYFDVSSSDEIGTPLVVMQNCHKLEVVNEARALDNRFDQTLLYRPVIELLKNQRGDQNSRVALPVKQEGSSFKIGTFQLPVCSWVEDDPSQYNREVLVDYIGAMVHAGFKSMYLRSADYYSACFKKFENDQAASSIYRKMRFAEDIYHPMLETDWLVIVNLHGTCPIAKFRGILFDVVQARFDSAKPTTLVLNQPFNAENETEKRLMGLVESWQKLQLK
jgi:hypothetical protein